MAVQDVIDSLNALDLDKLREEAMADVRSGKKTRRQAAVKKLRAIEGLKRSGVTPQDLLVKRVPVIPAAFRPYSAAGDTFIPGDANELYSDLHKAVQVHKETVAELGEEGAEDSASYLRSAVNAVYGYDDSPNPKIRNRRVSGFLTKILGSNPKVSWVQSKLLAKPQDFVGRGVITPNPDLGMDEVAIPKDMAWTLADPHLQKALVAQGIPTSRAMLMIRERHPTAQKVLEQVMRDIPVIYSRSPAWHAQNVISGYARIADGDNIEVSPLTTAGYSGDFDGDCKSMNEKDLWSIDGVIYFDTFARLVKLLNPEFPVTESSLHPIAEGRLKVVSFLEGRPVWLPVSHVHFHTKHGESVRVNLRSGFSWLLQTTTV
jgi:DNA-directed RNA polymerase subunit beta'